MSANNMFKGNNVSEAIDKACKSLNVSQEELNIEVLKTGSSGIFGLCRKKSLIKVSFKNQTEPSASTRPEKTKSKKTISKEGKAIAETPSSSRSFDDEGSGPIDKGETSRPSNKTKGLSKSSLEKDADVEQGQVSQELATDALETVKEYILETLALMGFPSDVTITRKENSFMAHINGDHVEDIIGPEGRILDSLQYLLRKMLSKRLSYKIALSLDAGNFRANRMKDLKNMGLELADEVKTTGKTRSIPSLNPSERRIIHMALQDDKEIRSRSVGEGLFKKILIYRPGKGKKAAPKKRRGYKEAKAKRPA